jgi:hypothetical protein
MSFRHVPLGASPEAVSSPERRATIRYHCAPATLGRVALPPKEETQQGWVLDISRNGLGLLLPRPLPSGLPVLVRMKDTAGANVYDLPGQVVHATKQVAGGEWVVGCRLDAPLTQDDLDALL